MTDSKRASIKRIRILLLVFLGLVLFLFFNVKTVVVNGNSMDPTFKQGRRLLVTDAYWLFGNIRKDDIVVVKEFTIRGGFFIKRVKYVGGDSVSNAYWPKNYSIRNEKYTVPDGMLFVLGDNRDYSEDSRSFGPIDKSLVIGKVLVWR